MSEKGSIVCDCSSACDFAPPEFHRAKVVTARKTHYCIECGEEIKPGDRYEYVVGKWDGMLETISTCSICLKIRDEYCPHGYCDGSLRETIQECLGFDYVDGEKEGE